MTRKHFEALAAIVRSHVDLHARNDSPASVETLRWLAEDMADTLARENARFDRRRFLAACGVSE